MPNMESMSFLWNRLFESLDSFGDLSLRPDATVALANLCGSASAITRGLRVNTVGLVNFGGPKPL